MLTALAGSTASAATYDRSTDSQQAIRDEGDASWGGGGGGGTDWTSTEKEHIRYRLQIDGTQTAPSADAATQLPVDVQALEGDAQSSADLKDFADAGYDPATNKVEGVKLVDTTTTNTDMRGTDGANTVAPDNSSIADILTDTGTTIPASLSALDGKIDTIDGVVDSILLDTGTDGVVISAAQAQSIADEVLKRSVANVESSAAEHTLATVVLAMLEGVRSGTTWTIRRSDGTTTHATKTLTTDASAEPVTEIQ